MKEPTRIYFVVPCYREEEILPDTLRRLVKKMYGLIEGGKAAEDSRILFVDDGSDDSTWSLIQKACRKAMVEGIRLTRNWGQQNALMDRISDKGIRRRVRYGKHKIKQSGGNAEGRLRRVSGGGACL